jgi:hypothetical protein
MEMANRTNKPRGLGMGYEGYLKSQPSPEQQTFNQNKDGLERLETARTRKSSWVRNDPIMRLGAFVSWL